MQLCKTSVAAIGGIPFKLAISQLENCLGLHQQSASAGAWAKQEGQDFPVPSTHKPRHDPAYAGVFPMIFMQVPGPYNITISDAAWIDVVQDGHIVKQTGFTGATGCHDVRKSVQFVFAKGPATIMVTETFSPTLAAGCVSRNRPTVMPPQKPALTYPTCDGSPWR